MITPNKKIVFGIIIALCLRAPLVATQVIYKPIPVSGNVIALTFDDGPHPLFTPSLLSFLASENIKATFFIIGKEAAKYPDLVLQISDAGHEIGNHSYSHTRINEINKKMLIQDIMQSQNLIQKITHKKPQLFRPPFGRLTDENIKTVKCFFPYIVYWTFDVRDWDMKNPNQITNDIKQGIKPGAILLFHENRFETVSAIPEVIKALRTQGYRFVTISELLALKKKPPFDESRKIP